MDGKKCIQRFPRLAILHVSILYGGSRYAFTFAIPLFHIMYGNYNHYSNPHTVRTGIKNNRSMAMIMNILALMAVASVMYVAYGLSIGTIKATPPLIALAIGSIGTAVSVLTKFSHGDLNQNQSV